MPSWRKTKMKKIIIVLFALLLLAGCSDGNHYSSLSNGDDVLFTGPNITYTKNDLYKSLKLSNTSGISSNILDKIALNLDGIDMDQINADADELIETYQSMGYESYIIASYGSVEAYRSSYVSSLLLAELCKEYVKEDFDHMVEEKKPVKMQVASFASLEDAEKCIEDVKGGSTFDMAAVNNNADSAPVSSVYTDDDSTLAFEIKDYLNSNENSGVSSVIVNTTTSQGADGSVVENNTYYVLNVESRDVETFKDEAISIMASELSTDDVKNYFLSTHQIEFFDQDLYKSMSSLYEVLK